MKITITGGTRKGTSDNYIFDYTLDLPTDLVNIVPPQIHQSIKNNNVYYFGYAFNPECSSKDRTEFIRYIKELSETRIPSHELEQFIQLPIKELNKYVNIYDLDCIVYPVSNKSPLVSKMIRCLNDYSSRDTRKCSFEFVKQAPTNISFDWELFEIENSDKQGYRDMCKYVEAQLMPAIQQLDYFSIARNVKSKYRRYITGFLDFTAAKDLEKYAKLNGSNILVVDDINTTGSTLNEILRILNNVNSSCNIFVYTLIGN